MKFALKLKELRESRNLTQRDLADILDISKGSIGMWESTDRMPNSKSLQQIAQYFNVPMEELLEVDITPEERAAGASSTRTARITPIEDEMLYAFRQVGKSHGEEAQRALITIAENMK